MLHHSHPVNQRETLSFHAHLDTVVPQLLDPGQNVVFKLFVGSDSHLWARNAD